MAQNYSNLTGGLRTQTQIPLDVKTYAVNEATLANLGTNNNLAFTYSQGLTVYCVQEGTHWIWREVGEGEEDTGLLTSDYTYPEETPVTFGITYANKVFNFFPTFIDGSTGPTGPAGTNGNTILYGTAAPTTEGVNGDFYIRTTTNFIYGPKASGAWPAGTSLVGPAGPTGSTGAAGTDASLNLQKTITGNYTIVNGDNNYTIMINNGATPVTITIPSGLMSNISVGFFRQGSADVTFAASGTTIHAPAGMLKCRVQYSNAYIEQVTNTNVFQLCGDLKS